MTALHRLADNELLMLVDNTDPLAQTDMERELARRFAETAGDERLDPLDDRGIETAKELIEALAKADKYDDLPANPDKLADALTEHDIDTPDELRKQLALAAVCAEFDIDQPDALRKQTKYSAPLPHLSRKAQSLFTVILRKYRGQLVLP